MTCLDAASVIPMALSISVVDPDSSELSRTAASPKESAQSPSHPAERTPPARGRGPSPTETVVFSQRLAL